MSDTDNSKYDSESDYENDNIEEYYYTNQNQNQSESEDEEEIKSIVDAHKVELLKIRKEKN